MIPKPCDGLNLDLLSYGAAGSGGEFDGTALAVMWAEDPDQVKPADGGAVATWNNPGSLGGLWTKNGASTVNYLETDFARPAVTFFGPNSTLLELLPVPPLTLGPFTLVTVTAIAGALGGNVLAAYPVADVKGPVMAGTQSATRATRTFKSSVAVTTGAIQDRWRIPLRPIVAEGRAVVGATEKVAINDTAFAAGDTVPAGISFDRVNIGGVLSLANYTSVNVFFAALYGAPTAPTGLIDAIKDFYEIVP